MSVERDTERKRPGLIRLSRWLAMGLVAVVTGVALVYAVENFRGKSAWQNYRKSAEQRGIALEFAAVIPPEIPDDQNAVSTPFVESWFDPRFRSKADPALWPPLFEDAQKSLDRNRDKTKRRLTDLVAWQEALALAETNEKREGTIRWRSRSAAERASAATNVLAALQAYEPALAELREGMKRPRSRYPVEYNVEQPFAILLPHLANIKRITQLLSVRASANLAANNNEAALQDVLLMLHLVESLEMEHFLITYLVQIAGLQITANAVWEAADQQRWNDAQWQQVQQRVARFNFLRGLEHALNTERAAGITTIDWIKEKQSAQRLRALSDPETMGNFSPASASLFRLMPRGWWDMEKVSYARIFESGTAPILAALKSGTLADAPGNILEGGLSRGIAAVWNHQVLASLLLPAIDVVHRKAGIAQALADELVVACALERARLADGRYPERLDALTPKLLPKPRPDVMTGKPLIYRTHAGGYVLYSVGWNRVDDGGVAGKTFFDYQHGDWVWRVQPEAPADSE